MKVMIAIPCLDSIAARTVKSLFDLSAPEGCETCVEFMESSLVYLSRDRLAVMAMEEKADFILWIDSDMVFPPDMLQKLIADAESGKDMITGLCFRRRPDYNPAIWKRLRPGLPGESVVETYDDYPEEAVFEVEACGMAAILMRTSVIREVFEKEKALFAPIPGYGEDVSFCLRARKAGFSVWCDSHIKVGHLAETIVTEDTFRAYRQKQEEVRNAQRSEDRAEDHE